MTPLWDSIDKVIYINLSHRKDRDESLQKQLRLLRVPPEKIVRFDACAHLLGHIGRTQSHLAVLNMAIESGWGPILVLEDDMCFNHTAQSSAALTCMSNALTALSWDVALLSANYLQVIPLKSAPGLVKPLKAFCACAYLVNAHYLLTLRDNYAASLAALLQGGRKNQYALDVHWQSLMMRDKWLGIYPVAGHQLPGCSNIEDGHMDYRPLFYKPLSDIAVTLSEVTP